MIDTPTHLYFYSGKEFYSNWHRYEFTDPITGVKFYNTEQAFMWYKADFFKDLLARDKIAAEPDAKKSKELGRQVRGYNERGWESVRLGYMTWVNYCKFTEISFQGMEIKKHLLHSGNKILVEASPYDKIWGVGLREDDPLILDEKTWNGQNLLGVALMKVRDMINQDEREESDRDTQLLTDMGR